MAAIEKVIMLDCAGAALWAGETFNSAGCCDG